MDQGDVRTEKPLFRSLFIVLSAAVIVAVAAFWWYTQPSPQASKVPPTIASAMTSTLSLNHQEAIDQARAYLATNENGEYAFSARSILAQELLNSATSTEDKAAAMAIFKQSFVAAETPRQRAAVINQIVHALLDSRVPYKEVFQDKLFESFKVAGSNVRSLQNLLAYSISLAPTADAHILLSRLDANMIIAGLEAGGTRPLDKAAVGNITLQDRAKRIEENIKKADFLIPQDVVSAQRSPYAAITWPLLHYWRGYTLGVAARINKAHEAEAEKSFENVISAAEKIDADGNAIPALKLRGAYAELAYAKMLAAVDGNARGTDIQAHLSNLVKLLAADPGLYKNIYRLFGSAKTGATQQQPTTYESVAARSYREYKKLASFSPEFTAFLISQGWQL